MSMKASRQAFGESLADLGERFPNVVVLDADLAKSTKSEIFAKRYPERFFEMGIAEQNMAGVAAGLGLSGKTAFCCSFACFIAGRFETLKISVAYSGANVKVVGTHAGVGIGEDGYSQMGLEDIALMRVLPTMRVFQPADEVETRQIVEHLCKTDAPAYLRLTRQNLKAMHGQDYRFVEGALDVLRGGVGDSGAAPEQVAIFASGGPVMHAVEAADQLREQGINAAVVNVPSIKPLDAEAVVGWADRVSSIVTVEDHNVLGGMGSVITEIVAESSARARVVRHGIPDCFGESGTPTSLYEKFRLDGNGIADVVSKACSA